MAAVGQIGAGRQAIISEVGWQPSAIPVGIVDDAPTGDASCAANVQFQARSGSDVNVARAVHNEVAGHPQSGPARHDDGPARRAADEIVHLINKNRAVVIKVGDIGNADLSRYRGGRLPDGR